MQNNATIFFNLSHAQYVWQDDRIKNQLKALMQWADENHISDDRIPRHAERLFYLKELDLSGCKLSGALPDAIGVLVHLERLDISSNQISRLPDSVGQWVNLKTFRAWNNQIKELPNSVGQWVNLKELYIHHNQISQLPDSVGQWVNLEVLDILNNPISRLPDSVRKILFISKNQLNQTSYWSHSVRIRHQLPSLLEPIPTLPPY